MARACILAGIVCTRLKLILFAVSTGSCATQSPSTPLPVFEFHSGGATHYEGFGEWHVRIGPGNKLVIGHEVNGRTKSHGPFALSDEDLADFQNLLRRASLANLQPSTRTGDPGEVKYTFVEKSDRRVIEAALWKTDALEQPQLRALIDYLRELIVKNVGEQPVLE
jgi:hypothetical protein